MSPLNHAHKYETVWGQHDLRCACGAQRPMKCVGVVLDSGEHLSCRSLAEPGEMRCKTCEEWE